MNTRQHAEACAQELTADFALMGTLVVIELFYYTFQLWKEWNRGCKTTPHAAVAATQLDDGNISQAMVRHSSRRLRRVAKWKRIELSQVEIADYTEHALLYVVHQPSEEVAMCCGDIDIPAALAATPE